MIDSHSHVLPGLDDGAENLSESVEIARLAVADGVTAMIATPHIRDDFNVAIGELPERVATLNGALDEADVEVEIHQGGEVAVYRLDDLDDDDLRAVSFGGESRYVLVETPYGSVPAGFEEALFRLALRGFNAVVAHPERSPSFQRRPERLTELVRRGILLQLTAGALSGAFGRSARDLAERLIARGEAHLLGSDVHHAYGSRASLRSARNALEGSGRAAIAAWMTEEVPAALLADAAPPPGPEPPPARRRRAWWRR
jgi:protein-tyrosine phosphatase